MFITNDIKYIGVNDHQVDLFEGQYIVPNGMSYNSYAILDDKIAVLDSVDINFTHEWLDNIQNTLGGRNPDYLIGQHVLSSIPIKKSGLKVIPVGYMLVESGRMTSVEYISNTKPIPSNKTDIAVCTAVAGELLGMRSIYLEGGSGADRPVPAEMIKAVKQNISIPLIVGGGIRTVEALKNAYASGADVVVVGNILEEKPELYHELFETLTLL